MSGFFSPVQSADYSVCSHMAAHTSPLLQAFLLKVPPEGYPGTGSAVAGVINAPEGKSLQSMGFRLFLQESTSDPVKAPSSSQPPSQYLHSSSLRLPAPDVATASLLLGTTYHELIFLHSTSGAPTKSVGRDK